MTKIRSISAALAVAAAVVAGSMAVSSAMAQNKSGDKHVSSVFKGAKVNSGTATAGMQGDKITLTWSDDFKIPDTPAPHWQVVDSKGNTYLLQRLKIKGDKLNRTITVPPYVQDVAKVQIYCAWAEALLGEASFETPIHQ